VDPEADVAAANQRYYQAFEERNLDAMSDLWVRTDEAVCTHPGWSTLRGWGRIAASYFTLFQNGQQLQFVITEQRIVMAGDTAWASLDENLLGDQGGVTVATLNLFVRRDEQWRMICHHGSVVNAALGNLSD
jgi:ketosteroid isomerase-like protein